MIRTPLRDRPSDRPVTGLATALERELTGVWPSPTERREFWTSPRVPSHLDWLSEPDPRPVLTGDPYLIERYHRDVAAFGERRTEWLRRQIR